MKYKEHPRILEIRLICLARYLSLSLNRGHADEFIRYLSETYSCNEQFIRILINKSSEVLIIETTDYTRFIQEISLACHLYGYDRFFIAKMLLKSPNTLNSKVLYPYELDTFISEEWFEGFDDKVAFCGHKAYAIEALRFIKAFDNFREVLV
jgi:predicted glycosyltransferase involved in capsule biosynthesis